MKNKDFEEVDKRMSSKIRTEFKGKIINCICPYCKGEKKYKFTNQECIDCNDTGEIQYEYA